MPYNKEHLRRDKNKPTRKELKDKSITTMLKRKHVDIDDLLARDDVNRLLSEVSEVKANVTDMIILYYDTDHVVHMKDTNPLQSKATYMLEWGKNYVLNDNPDEDED